MGRPRKTDAEKKLLGTDQPCRTKTGGHKKPRPMATLDENAVPVPPPGIPGDAAQAWEVVLQYLPAGYLTPENVSLMERWARTYALYRKTAKAVEKEGVVIPYVDSQGNEGIKENPAFAALMKLSATLATCERQLGFTPSTRAGVRATLLEEEEEVDNPYEIFSG